MTGDKDMMQLVSDEVRLHNIFKPKVDLVIEGPEEVHAKFGTDPEHVIDVLAIMGDASDNVPGVKGIGEKGAQKLIGEFGSVPALLERLDEVKGKNKEKIEADRDNLLLSRSSSPSTRTCPSSLASRRSPCRSRTFKSCAGSSRSSSSPAGPLRATSRPRVPASARTSSCATPPASRPCSRSFARPARSRGTPRPPGSTPSRWTSWACPSAAERAAPSTCRSTWMPPVLEGGTAALLDAVRPLMTDPDLQRVAQNEKYDALVMGAHGVDVPPPFFDTMVASFTIHGSSRRHNLDDLALVELGVTKIPTSQLIGKGKNQVTMAELPVDDVAEYACEDAEVTFRLFQRFATDLEETDNQQLFEELEMPLVRVLTRMERRGIRLDVAAVEAFAKELARDLEAAEDDVRITEIAGEPGDGEQPQGHGRVLFEKLRIQGRRSGVKRPKKTKTGYATDHATLDQLRGRGDRPAPARVSRGLEAQEHLRGRPPGLRQSHDGPYPLLLQPGGRRDRPAESSEPEPAEHPRPHGARDAACARPSSPARR